MADNDDSFLFCFIAMIITYFVYLIFKHSREKLEYYISSYQYRTTINSILDLNVKKISNSNIQIYNDTVMNDEKTDIEDLLCCVCKENKVKLMTIPCNHICLCLRCHKEMISSKCPICQTNIINYSRIYI